MTGRESLMDARPVAAVCASCGDLGLLRYPGGKCWLCGGWVGHEYPTKLALQVSDLARGWGVGFFGGLS